MTYFRFLLIFLGIPLMAMAFLLWRDKQHFRQLPPDLRTWNPLWVILAHVVVAVLYTTPWDNYLVATGVWYYDPRRITGTLLGWVPLEEYCFFVLQTILSGAWTVYLLRRISPRLPFKPNLPIRLALSLLAGLLWLVSAIALFSGYAPATYSGLILVWALFPIIIQCLLGGDILWHYRVPILTALSSITVYLAIADSLAINSGVWEISPHQSFNLLLFGVLPVEEFLFFLLTNFLGSGF